MFLRYGIDKVSKNIINKHLDDCWCVGSSEQDHQVHIMASGHVEVGLSFITVPYTDQMVGISYLVKRLAFFLHKEKCCPCKGGRRANDSG